MVLVFFSRRMRNVVVKSVRWRCAARCPRRKEKALFTYSPPGQQLICLCPCPDNIKIWARRLCKFLELFPQQIHNSIGRNYDVKCRTAEQGRICRQGSNGGFCNGWVRNAAEIHNIGELGIEVRIRGDPLAVAKQFSVRDPAVKRRVHNFTLGVDF